MMEPLFKVIYMRKKNTFVISMALLFLAGCGGGGGVQNSGSGSQTTSLGQVTLAYSGNAKAQVQALEVGLSVTSLAGGTISNLTYEPTPTLENTAIGYITPSLSLHTYQNGRDQVVLGGFVSGAFGATFSRDGHIYACTGHEDATFHIDRMYYDGTGSTSLYTSTGTNYYQNVSVSSDGVHLAYDCAGAVYAGTTSGGTPILLSSVGQQPAISPNGATVAFVKSVSGYDQVFTVPIGGGTPFQVTKDSVNHYYPCWGLAGDLILCDADSGTSRLITSYIASNGGLFTDSLVPAYPYASHASLSPDGKYITCAVKTTYSAATTAIVTYELDNGAQTIAQSGQTPFWSPYFPSRVFVGTDAWMYPSASGFLLCQLQSGFDSLLAFTATTPSSATVTQVTQSVSGSSGPPIYDVHADSVTSLKYQNTYFTGATALTPNTTDVLVTLDGTTGQINTVAPFLATRGQALHQPGSQTYSAHFTAVYDAHGKNLAPNGASQLNIDPKHGTATSIR